MRLSNHPERLACSVWLKRFAVLTLLSLSFQGVNAQATVLQDTNPFAPSGFNKSAVVAAPIQISEVPTASPYVAARALEPLTGMSLQISNYVSAYNRRLAAEEVNVISHAIVDYSARYNIDSRLLASIISVESAFRRDAISTSGAIGMGQLKPDTAKWLGVVNPYDPVDNIAGTARFVSWLVHRYKGNLEMAISAYYQGPGSVDRNGITPVCMPYLTKVNKALGNLL